jgi:hypothetical protein
MFRAITDVDPARAAKPSVASSRIVLEGARVSSLSYPVHFSKLSEVVGSTMMSTVPFTAAPAVLQAGHVELPVALGLVGWIAIVLGVVIGAVVLFLAAAAIFHERVVVREQRPFLICPECSGYNSRSEAKCWRCSHDLTASAVEPHGELGLRLARLESSKNS